MIFSHSYTPFSHSGIFVSIPIYIPEYDPDSTALVRCEHTDLSATATAPFGAVVNVDQVFKVADPFARFEPVENRDFEDSNAEQLFASVEFPSVRYRKSELSALKTTTTFSYRFPNPTTGGIVRFKVTVNHDRVIVGQVKPSDDAKAEYKDIIENHKDQAAGLATSFTRDIFQIDLGNIPWDSTVRVEIVSTHPPDSYQLLTFLVLFHFSRVRPTVRRVPFLHPDLHLSPLWPRTSQHQLKHPAHSQSPQHRSKVRHIDTRQHCRVCYCRLHP